MRVSSNIFSIDANVILRYVMKDDPKLFKKAYDILVRVESGLTTVICDPVNFAEVIWVLRSFYKLSNEQISEGLQPILNHEAFLVPDKERYVLALELFAEGLSFGDACTCAAAILECDGRLYSFDTDLSEVHGIARSEVASLSLK